jgi:hypothetical protein
MSVACASLGDMSEDASSDNLCLVGIATTAGLLASGTSASQIRAMTRNGLLIPLGRGVYARAQVASKYLSLDGGERLLRTFAALAVSGPDVVISHQSAAHLHQIDLLGRPGPTVTLTGRPGRDRHGRQGIHLHTAELPAGHVTTAFGFPTTTAARTVIDLARELNFWSGVVAADSALHRKLTTKDELRAVLAACPRWRGIRRAADAVEFADKRAESPLESIARVVFRDCGLPPPDLQVWLGGVVEPVGRVDFYWQRYRTVAEVDGDLKYQDPARAKAQLKRDALLRADGYEVVHFDWQEITGQPDYVAAIVWEAFRRGLRIARPAG